MEEVRVGIIRMHYASVKFSNNAFNENYIENFKINSLSLVMILKYEG